MRHHRARVESLEEVQPGAFLLGLWAEDICRGARPGQFYMLRLGPEADPYLPRAFSWLRSLKAQGASREEACSGIQILFQVVGKATGRLSRLHVGDEVEVVGPLGNGWHWEESRAPLLVGGGIGAASLVCLLESFPPEVRGRTRAVVGAKDANGLWCGREMSKLGASVSMAVERGAGGFLGTVVDLLRHRGMDLVSDETEVFACGPWGMLREVARWAKHNQLACQVSLEAPMACGVGVCLGCAVKLSSSGGYARVCLDGPVFRAEEIHWGEEDG